MPTFEVTAPDGRKFRVNAPEGATREQAIAYVQNGLSAKPTAAPERIDPTEGMSGYDKFMAGTGKAMVDTYRGLKQIATLGGNQAEIDEAARLDAPLMDTGAGIAGNVVGNLATMIGPSAGVGMVGKAAKLPAAVRAAESFLLPKTVAGAVGQGVGMGAIQPVAEDESRLLNMTLGGAGGAVVPAAVAGGKVVGNLVAPFTQGGRERIAARTLERFAADPKNILSPKYGQQLVPGSAPTLAEATGDTGIAQLQRTLKNNPDANIPLTAKEQANRAARANALQDIAGNPADRQAWVDAREQVTGDLYKQAFESVPKVTPWIKGMVSQLQKRPAFNAALERAQTIALNEGRKLDPANVVQVSHYTKMALDDMIEQAGARGLANEQRAFMGTKKLLVAMMESKDFSPIYRQAREEFARMSAPINQIDVGQKLLEKFQPALADFGADTRTTAAAFTNALRNADQTARTATGFQGAKMADILGPEQMGTVTGIAKDLGRTARAQDLGMARGSPTGQNLISQDILRQTLGPFGLPKSFAESTLAETLLRPVSFAYKVPETRVMGLLGELSAHPEEARKALLKELRKRNSKFDNLIRMGVSPGTAGLLGLSSQ